MEYNIPIKSYKYLLYELFFTLTLGKKFLENVPHCFLSNSLTENSLRVDWDLNPLYRPNQRQHVRYYNGSKYLQDIYRGYMFD